jgi:hypothetical protein
MKNLFEVATVTELKERIAHLRPDSVRQWGKMTPAQAVAHCSAAMQMATGELRPPRVLIGRLLGGWAKRAVIERGRPMGRNAPTDRRLVVADDRDLPVETSRLRELIDRFVAGGPALCTTHPHPFFGALTPVEWAQLMYSHLDHHLRQFQA